MSSKAEELVIEFNCIMKMCKDFHAEKGTRTPELTADFVIAISHRIENLAGLDKEAGDVLMATRYVQLSAEMQRIRRAL